MTPKKNVVWQEELKQNEVLKQQICLTGTEMAEIEVTGPKFYCKHVNFPPQQIYHLNQSLETSS